MIIGHFATTLVAKRQVPAMPWWLLIFSAVLIDLAMYMLVALGIEKLQPDPALSGPTLSASMVDMTYSHDLIPQVFWVILAGALVFLLTRNRKFAAVAMVLTAVHWLCDLVSGYGHFVFGPQSAAIGTDWYHTNLLAALIVEAVLGLVCVYWYVRGRGLSVAVRAALYGVFGLLPFGFLVI